MLKKKRKQFPGTIKQSVSPSLNGTRVVSPAEASRIPFGIHTKASQETYKSIYKQYVGTGRSELKPFKVSPDRLPVIDLNSSRRVGGGAFRKKPKRNNS